VDMLLLTSNRLSPIMKITAMKMVIPMYSRHYLHLKVHKNRRIITKVMLSTRTRISRVNAIMKHNKTNVIIIPTAVRKRK